LNELLEEIGLFVPDSINVPMRKFLFVFLIGVSLTASVEAQAPLIQWKQAYGGTGDESAYDILNTYSGGYMVVGSSLSPSATGAHGLSDYWVVRTDAAGTQVWERAIGGSGDDFASCVVEDANHSVVVGGATASSNGDFFSFAGGGGDIGVTRIDTSGSIMSVTSFGGSGYDYLSAMRITPDGGLILGSYTNSTDNGVINSHAANEFWVVKLTYGLSIDWQHSYGGTADDYANDIILTQDGGYLVVGTTNSNDGDVTGYHAGNDAWVVKLDSVGTLEWQKTLGGSGMDRAYGAQQTLDGGYAIAGFSDSNDGDVSGNHGAQDVWIVRLDANGAIVWQKSLGGTGNDRAASIELASDYGLLVAGTSDSNDGDVSGNHGGDDLWAIKVDDSGNLVWQKSMGGSEVDGTRAATVTAQDEYVVAGYANSDDGNVSGQHGGSDFWVVGLGSTVTETQAQDLNEVGFSIFPNPTRQSITLRVVPELSGTRFTVSNVLGERVFEGKLRGESNLVELENLCPGIYFLQMEKRPGQSIKLIKQ
jgi:hypothetical protein